jgi:hypothetical protein
MAASHSTFPSAFKFDPHPATILFDLMLITYLICILTSIQTGFILKDRYRFLHYIHGRYLFANDIQSFGACAATRRSCKG